MHTLRYAKGNGSAIVLAAGVAMLLFASGSEAFAPDDPPSAAAETVHTTMEGDLVLRVEREGRIDSAHRTKVRVIPQAFGGPFEIHEVVKSYGPVRKGDVLLRFKAEGIENDLDAAEQAADHAKRRLQIAREELRIQEEQNQTRIEQVEKAKSRAETELLIWEKFDGPKMARTSELSMMQREFALADERQELAQLEEMYKGTHLATETKDIVLERAQRGVKMSESWLELARGDQTVARDYRYPQRERDVNDALKWAVQDEAHTRISARGGMDRKRMEVESAERVLHDAEERLGKLKQDQALVTLAAPDDGWLTRIELEPKDQVSGRQTIAEIIDPTSFIVKFDATAEDLRVLTRSMPLTIVLPEYPEAAISGELEELGEVGGPADKATNFPARVSLKSDDPLVRIGLRCKVIASRTLKDALLLPRTAIQWKNGVAVCTVRDATGDHEREITVGAGTDDQVSVIKGIKPGDVVVVPAVKK